MTKRDNIDNEDKVGVFLDLYHDQQSSVGFMVNPLGVQEDVITDDKFESDGSEDFVWYSAGAKNETGYAVEIRIPLKSIRYPAGDEVIMGIGFRRRIVRLSEWDAYPAVSRDEGTVLSYPDFNQVEADASQVEFNQRSAVIYDEKRPFFLEGTEHLFISGVGGKTPP